MRDHCVPVLMPECPTRGTFFPRDDETNLANLQIRYHKPNLQFIGGGIKFFVLNSEQKVPEAENGWHGGIRYSSGVYVGNSGLRTLSTEHSLLFSGG